MKKMMTVLVAMLAIAATGKAMSYEQARNEALFLTDKMAYELNLTDEQYEAAYEINLDYLMGVTSYDDVYGTYWERRNLDLSYVLLDWQWNSFIAASYFYRPLYWSGGYWHFAVYARYPHRDYFYFGRPVFYASYRGGHAWHRIGGRGWYYSRREYFRPVGRSHFGMHDRWHRGDYRGHHPHGGGYGHRYGGSRISSTRTTVYQGGGRSISSMGNVGSGRRPSGSYGNNNTGGGYSGGGSYGGNNNTGGYNSGSGSRVGSGTRGISNSGMRSISNSGMRNISNSGMRSNASFGSSRSISNSTYSGGSRVGSFGGGRSSGGGSFSGGSTRSFGGGAGGGGSFGGGSRVGGGRR